MSWLIRIPLKWTILAIVVFFVLFPNPAQFIRHLRHVSNFERMIEPNAPQFAVWEAELRDRLTKAADKSRKRNGQPAVSPPMSADTGPTTRPGDHEWNDALSPKRVQKEVEKFTYEKVKYDWDWNVWGSADYMPTVAEMFESAGNQPDGVIREDCDGRAVMAASLMRRLGYQSSIVTDLRHVWVTTPQGDWMGPGRKTTMRSTKAGNKVDYLSTISNVPVSLSYGVAVFPLWREVILTLTIWLLLCRLGMGWRTFFFGGLLLFQGLLFMRMGVLAPASLRAGNEAWPAWVGLIHAVLAMGFLYWASWRVGRRAIPLTSASA